VPGLAAARATAAIRSVTAIVVFGFASKIFIPPVLLATAGSLRPRHPEHHLGERPWLGRSIRRPTLSLVGNACGVRNAAGLQRAPVPQAAIRKYRLGAL
jgi:hypothetical protein